MRLLGALLSAALLAVPAAAPAVEDLHTLAERDFAGAGWAAYRISVPTAGAPVLVRASGGSADTVYATVYVQGLGGGGQGFTTVASCRNSQLYVRTADPVGEVVRTSIRPCPPGAHGIDHLYRLGEGEWRIYTIVGADRPLAGRSAILSVPGVRLLGARFGDDAVLVHDQDFDAAAAVTARGWIGGAGADVQVVVNGSTTFDVAERLFGVLLSFGRVPAVVSYDNGLGSAGRSAGGFIRFAGAPGGRYVFGVDKASSGFETVFLLAATFAWP